MHTLSTNVGLVSTAGAGVRRLATAAVVEAIEAVAAHRQRAEAAVEARSRPRSPPDRAGRPGTGAARSSRRRASTRASLCVSGGPLGDVQAAHLGRTVQAQAVARRHFHEASSLGNASAAAIPPGAARLVELGVDEQQRRARPARRPTAPTPGDVRVRAEIEQPQLAPRRSQQGQRHEQAAAGTAAGASAHRKPQAAAQPTAAGAVRRRSASLTAWAGAVAQGAPQAAQQQASGGCRPAGSAGTRQTAVPLLVPVHLAASHAPLPRPEIAQQIRAYRGHGEGTRTAPRRGTTPARRTTGRDRPRPSLRRAHRAAAPSSSRPSGPWRGRPDRRRAPSTSIQRWRRAASSAHQASTKPSMARFRRPPAVSVVTRLAAVRKGEGGVDQRRLRVVPAHEAPAQAATISTRADEGQAFRARRGQCSRRPGATRRPPPQ